MINKESHWLQVSGTKLFGYYSGVLGKLPRGKFPRSESPAKLSPEENSPAENSPVFINAIFIHHSLNMNIA